MSVLKDPLAFPLTEIRAMFPGASEAVYLNSAAESLFMESHRGALSSYADQKSRGAAGRAACADVESRCRSLVAELLGVHAGDIAFLASTARGLDVVIKSIEWREGDNIVLADSEFPTAAFAAARLASMGVEHRVVRARGGELLLDDFAEQIDARTRLVCVSAVSYKNGFKIDIPSFAAVAHAAGALLFVDAVQAMGVVPLDARLADFLCAGTYKWLLGSHGLAVFYVNPRLVDELVAPYVGYRGVVDIFPSDRFDRFELFPDARRFEEGMPNYPGLFVLENALSFLLSVGVERISEHVAGVVMAVMKGLDDMGVQPLTTRDSAARGAIVSFETRHAERVVTELEREGIRVWGRDGRVRISPHLYNGEDDVVALFDRLRVLVAERGLRLQ